MNDTFEVHRNHLNRVAYSIVGTWGDAEDIVQDAFLRWQRAQPEETNLRAYLSKVVTRLALDHLKSARVRRELYCGPWLPEPLVEEVYLEPSVPSPSAAVSTAEQVSHALMVVLQKLSPTERAAFLLRKVFEVEYSSIASTLGKSEAACRQLVRRARQRVQEERRSQPVAEEVHANLVMGFAQATLSGDLNALEAVLSGDIELHSDHGGKATAARRVVLTPAKVARFFVGVQKKAGGATTASLARVNGTLGIVVYQGDVPINVLSFQTSAAGIERIYSMRNPDKIRVLL